MKPSVLTILLALLSAACAAAPASDLSVRLDLPYTSRYVYRGVQLAQSSIQPSLDLSANGSYAGVWLNSPITAGQKNEFDFYLGHDFAADSLGAGGKIDLGGRAYYYPQGHYTPGLGQSSFEAYLGLTGRPVGLPFTPSIYSYYDFTRKSYNFIGSLGTALPVGQLGFAVQLDVHGGYAGFNGTVGKNYTYWGAGARLPYRIANNATFTLGGQYDTSNLPGTKHNLFTFTAGVTVGF